MFIDDLEKSILQKAMNWELIEWSNYNSREENKMEDCCTKIETWNSISENIKKTKYTNLDTWYNFIATKDLEFNHSFQYENWIKIPYDEPNFKYADTDNILLCIEWWSAGRKIWILSQKVCYWNKLCKFSVKEFINPRFLYYFLQSPDFQKLFRENINGLIWWVSIGKIRKLVLKYPPLEEQKRIVAKLDELMPLLDEARPLEEEITRLEKDFPSKLRQSILQYAIQWKLVEQNSTDEPASELLKKIKEEKERLIKKWKIKKEKALEPIKDEEKPFDIPSNWKWVRLGEIWETNTWNTPSTKFPEYYWWDIPFVWPWNISYSWFLNYDTEKTISNVWEKYARIVNKWDILQVCIWGSIWKCAVVDRKIAFNQQLNSISIYLWNCFYIRYILNSSYFQSTMRRLATWWATPILNWWLWKNICVPLPPLEEQKRIVTKLDELMKLCDELEEQIG